MNPLENSPDTRARVYVIFWCLGLALGATQVGFAAADTGQPMWLTVALAVYAFLGAGVGYTAGQNVTQPHREDGELGAIDSSLVVTLAAIVVILCGLVWLLQAL